jgi:hypothetical protein
MEFAAEFERYENAVPELYAENAVMEVDDHAFRFRWMKRVGQGGVITYGELDEIEALSDAPSFVGAFYAWSLDLPSTNLWAAVDHCEDRTIVVVINYDLDENNVPQQTPNYFRVEWSSGGGDFIIRSHIEPVHLDLDSGIGE